MTHERISWYSARVSIPNVDVPYGSTIMRWRDEIEENGLKGWMYVNVVRRGQEQDTDEFQRIWTWEMTLGKSEKSLTDGGLCWGQMRITVVTDVVRETMIRGISPDFDYENTWKTTQMTIQGRLTGTNGREDRSKGYRAQGSNQSMTRQRLCRQREWRRRSR